MLHARAGKGSGKQLPAHPFFYGARSLPCCLFHAAARLYAVMECGISGTAAITALSCSMLQVCLIRTVFSLADVVELLTIHVEFNLLLPLAVLFQGIRQGVHSLRHDCLLPFFHAAHTA